MILGLIFALGSAFGTNLGFWLKHRGAMLAPPIRVRHPVRSAADLFRSRWFAVGWLVSFVAWGLHVEALSLASLSSVQAVLSGGLVFLAVLAERFFGFPLGRRQWAGVTITAVGLVVIGLTAKAEGPQRASLAALIAFESAIMAVGVGLVRISTRRGLAWRRESLLLATAAGVLFGVSDVAVKYLTHAHGPLLGLVSPWTLTALGSFVISFLCLSPQLAARARGRGDRDHHGGRQPRRDPRRHPRLRGANRLRRARNHRPRARVLPRDRRRSARTRPTTRKLRHRRPHVWMRSMSFTPPAAQWQSPCLSVRSPVREGGRSPRAVPCLRRPYLRALAERAGDGVRGRAHAELGFQAREALPNSVKAEEQLLTGGAPSDGLGFGHASKCGSSCARR